AQKKLLPLGVLGALSCFMAPVFFSFHSTWVTSDKTSLFERRAEIFIDLYKRAGNPLAGGGHPTPKPPPLNNDLQVNKTPRPCHFQRLEHNHTLCLTTKVFP